MHNVDVSCGPPPDGLTFPHLATLDLSCEYPDLAAYTSFPFTPSVFPFLRDIRLYLCANDAFCRRANEWPLSSITLSIDSIVYAPSFKQIAHPILWDFPTPEELWGSRPSMETGEGAIVRCIPSPKSQIGRAHV